MLASYDLFRTFLGRLLLILQQSFAELHFELILNQKKQFVNMAECSLIALLLIETSAGEQSRRSRSPSGSACTSIKNLLLCNGFKAAHR
jgi:hypothetical protein